MERGDSRTAVLGIRIPEPDYVVALAGNPNTGKSTVFNALTGLRQHTGNWPGKTVARAEGGFEHRGRRYALVDLPGTYSLLSASVDEEIARDFILFGRPDCTIVVADATALERNLNLVLQVLEITDRVVVCANLMDEARRKGLSVDCKALSRDLGVPVVATSARRREGLDELIAAVAGIAEGSTVTRPRRLEVGGAIARAADDLAGLLEHAFPGLPSARWIGMRLLDGDQRVREAVHCGTLPVADGRTELPGASQASRAGIHAGDILVRADLLRRGLDDAFRDRLVEAIYAEAQRIAGRAVRETGHGRVDFDRWIDRALTSRNFGLPIMLATLAVVFWITISLANVPSELLATLLFWIEEQGAAAFARLGAPAWLTGLIWHGTYRGLAWVVSVMLPPMAIFFPLFTILEDLGYLPRVAFNLDRLFRRAGAHGKQALTMSMGFGCNAAGVIATRIIDSPRERLIAILTNTFVPCNGRFPTLILLASVFVAAALPPHLATVAATGSVVLVVLIGVIVTLVASWIMSRTVLRGEPSAFTLELPPFRRPDVIRILYTSLIDRTLFVLMRAVKVAVPAGTAIWILGNVDAGGRSLSSLVAGLLDPLGKAVGLDGVILLAFVIAIPANEIVLPTVLMVYAGAGMMIGPEGFDNLRDLLAGGHGWTLLTAMNLMLFSLLHNPCGTTIWTIWAETRSARWTLLGALVPLGIAFAVTFAMATLARALGWN
jgi:ferrous iron transport protein B